MSPAAPITPMAYIQAVYMDDVDAAARQLDLGMAVDATFRGDTALILAARLGSAAMCALLLAHGADVHARDEKHGGTVVFNALCGYDVDAGFTARNAVAEFLATARVLLDAGADPRQEAALIATFPASPVRALLLTHAQVLEARELAEHLARRWAAGGHCRARARL